MELIAIASGKGGAGKTLIASCLGYALIRSGHRVLLIDADPATDGLSLFLLGMNGMRQIGNFNETNTFSGILRRFQQTGQMEWEAFRINRSGTDQQGDHGVFYDGIISGKGLYGDPVSSPVVPDLDQTAFRSAVKQLFASVTAANQYDYVIVDTRGGFAFESTDVCALADSFIVVTEADATSFYQDRNLVRRINDAAEQLGTKPLLRSFIVNKTSDWELTDPKNLQKVEQTFRLEIEKEFPVKFLDTYPVPLDIEAIKAYKTQRIPYLAAPASLFAYATLSAYRDILQIVTARWSEEQAKQWNALVQDVSRAIDDRNAKIKAELDAQVERKREFEDLQKENKDLKERESKISREKDEQEERYKRELTRSAALFSPWRTWQIWAAILAGVAAVAIAGWTVWEKYWGNPQQALLASANNAALPLATRVRDINQLSHDGYKSFDAIKLLGANFAGVPLDNVSFRLAELSNASFRGVSMRGCDLTGADLTRADLSNADLSGCRLRNADFTGANLDNANLANTDRSNAIGLPEEVPVVPVHALGEEVTLFDNWNTGAVQNGPGHPTLFRTTQTYRISAIATYHWNYGEGAPMRGFITIRGIDGPTKSPGCLVGDPKDVTYYKDVAVNVNWSCHPVNLVISPGTYEVTDSSPSTWSQNAQSGNRGFVRVTGYAQDEPHN